MKHFNAIMRGLELGKTKVKIWLEIKYQIFIPVEVSIQSRGKSILRIPGHKHWKIITKFLQILNRYLTGDIYYGHIAA